MLMKHSGTSEMNMPWLRQNAYGRTFFGLMNMALEYIPIPANQLYKATSPDDGRSQRQIQ